MKKNTHWGMFGILMFVMSACSTSKNLTQYVDPRIGTGDHGHVFLGANVPYGAVQVGPTEMGVDWDWCSGYHVSDSIIVGFAQTHLSGTGIGDLGDIALMPAIGEVKMARGKLDDPQSGMYSKFSHDNEVAKAGYYRVLLDRFGIEVELTATKRVGFHKYTFPASSESNVIIDLKSAIGWDALTSAYMQKDNDSTVSGYRYSKGWAANQKIYFTAVFSKKFTKSLTAGNAYMALYFNTEDKQPVYAKVAISPVSIQNAKENMHAELAGWDFDATVLAADSAWNNALHSIEVKSKSAKTLRTFYTAFYHTMIAPSLFCDVNGDYMGSDGVVYKNANFVNYTTFSLWDTYRAAQPLMTLVRSEMIPDIAQTMIHIYKQQGKLPVWHLWGNETNCMVGNPGVVALADIVLKNFLVDKDEAYDALKNSSLLDDRAQHWMKTKGYIPCDKETESVSKSLEYGLADWSVAQVAKSLNKQDDYLYFTKQSMAYKHFYDPSTGFLRGKNENGQFRTPFNPFFSEHEKSDYTEGNAWQYTFLAPHDVKGLINLFGSEERFTQKLDSLFVAKGDMGPNASPDISGLIGQYAHGNEPSHHILYLYNYVGQPWKTADKVRQVMSEFYSDQPAGLSGNEDVGQMSAWYVLSALGIYQVEPAGGEFIFGSPIVDQASLNVGNGKILKLVVSNNSEENKYIQKITLNGRAYTKSYISFNDLKAGGILKFEMGSSPSKIFGVNPQDRPQSKNILTQAH